MWEKTVVMLSQSVAGACGNLLNNTKVKNADTFHALTNTSWAKKTKNL